MFFEEHTIFHLVKHFKNPKIGLVGGNILNLEVKKEGISNQEKQYLSIENKLKYQEGVRLGNNDRCFWRCLCYKKNGMCGCS